MAFTAGSPELAKAQKLGAIFAHFVTDYGITAASGLTGAQTLERRARAYGFGVTGLTTGNVFPPFGSAGPNNSSPFGSLTAVLQNPAGLTRPNGLTVGILNGLTIGIYMKRFTRDGSDVTVTNSATGAVAGNTLGFTENTVKHKGYTATIYFNGSSSGETFSVN